jgi:hypothetical protein
MSAAQSLQSFGTSSYFGDVAKADAAQAEIPSNGLISTFHVKLVSKRDVGMKRTFDLTVKSPAGVEPAFTAGGVVVHVSQMLSTSRTLLRDDQRCK